MLRTGSMGISRVMLTTRSGALRLGQLRVAMLARGAHEAREQRMTVTRRRGEFRMELRRHEPRMTRQLDDLDQSVLGQPREAEAGRGVAVHVLVVELVAVAVTLAHDLVAVDGTRQRVGRDH